MDRRFFLTSLLGVAGASAATALLVPKVQALPLYDELAAMVATGANPLADTARADLPAESATEAQYYYGPPPGYYRRRRPHYGPRPRVRRCRTFYDRWGRLVRRCWWG